MRFETVKGYLMVLFSGAIILAASLLIILNWTSRADLHVFAWHYSIRIIEGGTFVGGFNTALLMILSAVGGVVALVLARTFIRGAAALRKGRKAAGRADGARP